jgi:hypothetical protein
MPNKPHKTFKQELSLLIRKHLGKRDPRRLGDAGERLAVE